MAERIPEEPTPTAFVSYSWDDEPHRAWVKELAARLRGDGVDVTLDQWQLQPGDRLPAFMEAAVRDNDFVLIVCTPHYKERSDEREGGVGYEGGIMTGELLSKGNERKFIPVLRYGQVSDAVPLWLAGKYYIDLRDSAGTERSYSDLLTTLVGQREAPPPLGRSSEASAFAEGSRPSRDSESGATGPIGILGVDADEVSPPHMDGTRGSVLYRVPLRLSRTPSADWAALFQRTWDDPSRFTTMHRPGVLSVQGDRIVLDGTTMEELERHHRDTLVLVLDEVNRDIAEREDTQRKRAEAERQSKEEHRRNVEDVAQRLRFDDRVLPDEAAASTTLNDSQPSSTLPWSVEGQAAAVPSGGRDASGFAWKLRRLNETRSVVVWISGSAVDSDDSALPREVAEAKHTKGLSALGALLSQDSPPVEVLVSTYGVRWEGADTSDGEAGSSPEGNDESRVPGSAHLSGSSDRAITRLGLLERLRGLIFEAKDAAREALDHGDQVTPRLINAERRIQTVMKQLGDQEFPLELTNFANQAQNARSTMSGWQAADAAVEKMILDATH